ncbi:Transducin/WD40 repeat-like superfamily protein [Tripterygium wilfordii]|uniref:Transducin/WD40 repeat-like superfamily protein n=1 Tax=Tripterygium wilfordii TaxID=458696 RepID=A0A7J7DCN8_TRIWF|nr:WD repeat-containing protein GTS1-like [Tripterygium wilfordii]XP_038708153.1 WD repeat-containing protein GTS1-like [Tripterygium wilfordii]KAF5744145.1 Transducin/WD40 repeat-like superfamily protein [Tripterygium wilfordii]
MMEEGSEMMEVEEPKSQMHPNSIKRFGLKNFISTNFDDGYVFQIVPKDDRTQMAVSLSTNAVKLYSSETGQFIGECKGHSGTINHLSFSGPSGPHVLHSCSSDGTLRAWDTRTFHEVSGVSASSSQEIFSFSFGGSTNNLLSTGCKSQILFWDWRSKKQVACLEESHTDDVTQVHFVPDSCNKLVSASADGLICIFDTDGDINDDDNLESVSNVGSSIGKVGFFGESYQKLWCLTHIETLSIWDWKDGRNEANLQDARSLASDSWTLDHVDYFVDCHHSGDRLWAIGGTNTGSIGYFPVDYTGGGRIKSPEAILGGGHIDVVRSVLPMSSENGGPAQTQGIFGWTGGEDGRLCCWLSDDSNNMNQSWISSELVTRSPRINRRYRHSPY